MSKRRSALYLAAIVCSLSMSSIASIYRGESIAAPSLEHSSHFNNQLTDFKFTDYGVSDTEEVRQILVQAFPIGSSFDSFTVTMESLGAENRGGDDGVTPDNQVYYYHQSGLGFVKTVWVIGAKHDQDKRIEEITVKSGLIGP